MKLFKTKTTAPQEPTLEQLITEHHKETKKPLHIRFIRALLFSFALLFLGSITESLYPAIKRLYTSYSFTPAASATVAQDNQTNAESELPRPPDNVLLQTANRRKALAVSVGNRINNPERKAETIEKLSKKDRQELNRLLDRIKGRN